MNNWLFITMFAGVPACPLCSSKGWNVFHVVGDGCSGMLPLFPVEEKAQ
jgi:hypothetical protein